MVDFNGLFPGFKNFALKHTLLYVDIISTIRPTPYRVFRPIVFLPKLPYTMSKGTRMTRNYHYTFFRFLIVGAWLVCTPLVLCAQEKLPKNLRKAAQATTTPSAVQPWATHFSPNVGLPPSSHLMLPPAVQPPKPIKAPSHRKIKRLVRRQEKQGVPRFTALRRAVEELGTQPSSPWPKTVEGELTVPNLEGLTLDGYQETLPFLPIPTNKIYLYRGMGLDEPALRNVLQQGLRVQDVTNEANALELQTRLLSAGTMPLTRKLLEPHNRKQIYLAVNAEYVLHFAYIHSFKEGKIPVVVVVKSSWRNGDHDHVITQDIPAEDFVEVAALIQGPYNEPIWCKVSLAPDGTSFIFAPYQLSSQP